jgi:hypothetical protein
MKKKWVVDVEDQCGENGIPFFCKQWSGVLIAHPAVSPELGRLPLRENIGEAERVTGGLFLKSSSLFPLPY